MAKLNLVHQLLFLALLFSMTKVTNSQRTLDVDLNDYREKSNDKTPKCIKLCVTTSPSGFPRCNLNTTTGSGIAKVSRIRRNWVGFPDPHSITFEFTEWTDNSELTAIVWKLPSGQSCDTTGPTNSTNHGEAGTIIAVLKQYKTYVIVSDKWKLNIRTKLICNNPGCLLPCVPRDNSTGHYTCHDGNKNCLPKWYGQNCLKTCVKPTAPPGKYKCSKTGEKGCLTNWFDENCTTFCNKTSSTDKCRKNGSRICNPNQFGRDCNVFCDKNATSYSCDKDGRRMCLPNWFNQNCDQFCDSSEGNYICDGEGHPVCLLHWYGEKCTKYCNNSATHYKCSDKGDRVCSRDWYHTNCSKFCDNSNKQFKCNVDGDKVCLKNRFGKDCSKFCNNSDAHYRCNDKGDMECLRDWYGTKCSKFCNNTNDKFKCNVDGDKICMQNWYGENCMIFCNNTALLTALLEGDVVWYHCDKNGNKTCAKNRYGQECDLRYTPVGYLEPSEINSGLQQSETGLYYCEIEEGMKQKHVSCPEGWNDTNCLKDCENINKDVEKYKRKCDENNGRALLCSNTTANVCSWVPILQQKLGAQKAPRRDVSNVKLYGGLFGTLFLMLIITTIVVVYVSLKKKKQATTTSPLYENRQAMTDENFTRNFNRSEQTLNIDELRRCEFRF